MTDKIEITQAEFNTCLLVLDIQSKLKQLQIALKLIALDDALLDHYQKRISTFNDTVLDQILFQNTP
jgi:hypothetical protein